MQTKHWYHVFYSQSFLLFFDKNLLPCLWFFILRFIFVKFLSLAIADCGGSASLRAASVDVPHRGNFLNLLFFYIASFVSCSRLLVLGKALALMTKVCKFSSNHYDFLIVFLEKNSRGANRGDCLGI